jgi:hypothetical protein
MVNGAPSLLILQSESCRQRYSMRASKPGAVDIDPISQRQRRVSEPGARRQGIPFPEFWR